MYHKYIYDTRIGINKLIGTFCGKNTDKHGTWKLNLKITETVFSIEYTFLKLFLCSTCYNFAFYTTVII